MTLCSDQEKYHFLNIICNLCRYAQFLQARSFVWSGCFHVASFYLKAVVLPGGKTMDCLYDKKFCLIFSLLTDPRMAVMPLQY